MYVYALCFLRALGDKEGIPFPGTGVVNICEPPCWCWEFALVLCKSNKCLESLESFLQSPGLNFLPLTSIQFSSCSFSAC